MLRNLQNQKKTDLYSGVSFKFEGEVRCQKKKAIITRKHTSHPIELDDNDLSCVIQQHVTWIIELRSNK